MRHWFAAERRWPPAVVDKLGWNWALDHIEWTANRFKGYETGG